MNIYQDLFATWADVQKEYDMKEKEPDEVLVAFYGYESYSGSSVVMYRNGESYFIVEGSHCSCYGLEGQWNPEEYNSKELFLKILEKRSFYGDPQLDKIKEMVLKGV